MKPKDQLIKEIEKLDLWADRGRKKKIISTIKSFLKGYKLVKKGDLLTRQEIYLIKSCGVLSALPTGQFNRMQCTDVEEIIRKLYALEEEREVAVKNTKEKGGGE